MKILIYSFNDKIGDGLQKITFIQELKKKYPDSLITYSTTRTSSLKNILNPLIKGMIDEFIEFNEIESSFINLFKEKRKFHKKKYDLIIDLQKVVLRTLNLKKISHIKFFSTSANFLFSDFKNYKNFEFKNIYIERFYFNILSLITNEDYEEIPNIHIKKDLLIDTIIKTDINQNIAIAPGAGDILRQWSFKKYLEVAKKLRSEGFNVYFFLGPDERKYLDICLKNNFPCPEWKDNEMITDDINFTFNLARKMKCLLCNDGGTAWMFEFAGIKTLKIFGITDEKKFARPGFSKTIKIQDYGFTEIKKFPLECYTKILKDFLKDI